MSYKKFRWADRIRPIGLTGSENFRYNNEPK